MKLYLITAISVLFLIIYPLNILPLPDNTTSSSLKKEKNLANVAILNFVNNTGNEEFIWMRKSLGIAVYESMKESFEFNRTDTLLLEKISKKRFKPHKEPDSSDIAYLAKQTHSDIVIFGVYEFDKIKNKIIIKTKIFHASRVKITSVINIESDADSTLFKAVDQVSKQIVSHITVIAKEYIVRTEKFSKKKNNIKAVTIETPEEDKSPEKVNISNKDDIKVEKREKILLQRVEDLQTFSKYFYVDITVVYYSPTLIYKEPDISYQNIYIESAKDVLSGVGARITFTNTYSSFLLFGGSFNFAYIPINQYFNSTSLPGISSSTSIQPLIGLNWNINNIVFIQPYIQAGIALESFPHTQKSSTSQTNTLHLAAGVFSFGIKVPIRVGMDLFITPFIEIAEYVYSDSSFTRTIIIAGLGISF